MKLLCENCTRSTNVLNDRMTVCITKLSAFLSFTENVFLSELFHFLSFFSMLLNNFFSRSVDDKNPSIYARCTSKMMTRICSNFFKHSFKLTASNFLVAYLIPFQRLSVWQGKHRTFERKTVGGKKNTERTSKL